MKLILVICALISANYVTAYDSEEMKLCLIEGLEMEEEYDNSDYGYGYVEHTNDLIFDDHNGPVLKLKKGSITEASSSEYSDNDIVVSIQGDEIVFELSDEYKNYDFDYETSTRSDNVKLYGEFTFKCPDGETYMDFYQELSDKNNHEPKFNRNVYTYKFGMDVSAGFELTKLMEIFAVDLDFTDKELTFTIEQNEYLKIESKYSNSNNERGKTHYASLVTKQAIEGKFNNTFTITVTDKNEDHTGEAKVTLIRV